jgi:putative ABC transport system substrate-binding protein
MTKPKIIYTPCLTDMFRGAETSTYKIHKGARLAHFPVKQSTKFDLFLNGKTAVALGLTIPQSLLISADKVIE